MLRVVAVVFVAVTLAAADVPKPPDRDPAPNADAGLPVGKWNVEFANGVKEVCEIRQDGTASVTEPLRTSNGKATIRGAAIVIVFEDDRIERWTPVGQRLVVEHWFPGSQLPAATPVLGIAERMP